MCNLAEYIEKQAIRHGYAAGYAEGIASGKFEITVKYYKKEMITAEEAAFDLGMTADEFLKKVDSDISGKDVTEDSER